MTSEDPVTKLKTYLWSTTKLTDSERTEPPDDFEALAAVLVVHLKEILPYIDELVHGGAKESQRAQAQSLAKDFLQDFKRQQYEVWMQASIQADWRKMLLLTTASRCAATIIWVVPEAAGRRLRLGVL
eukprot:GHVU01012937.1.p4 GENE.GHVU01012937.1~~GHVU01012937.1.p4  ORF type:complete len:128 (+),score=19.12 GHVU01012937.1:1310-1693(+)